MTGIAEKRKKECAAFSTKITEKKCYTHITTGEKTCIDPQDNPENQKIPRFCFSEYDDSSYLANDIWNYNNVFIQRGLYIGNYLYTLSPSLIQANTYGGGYGVVGKISLK